jgi:hypothetical protein
MRRRHGRHLGGSRTFIRGGATVNIVVMFGVASLMVGSGAYFFVAGRAWPVLYTGFMAAAGVFALAGLVMSTVGIVMMKRRRARAAAGSSSP